MTESNEMDERIEGLRSQVRTARGYERLLKAELASVNATSSSNDVRANVRALELEKEELTIRLEGFRSGRIKAVPLEEKEMVDAALDDWTRKAISRKRIFMELWAIVRDGLPRGKTIGQLWVKIMPS